MKKRIVWCISTFFCVFTINASALAMDDGAPAGHTMDGSTPECYFGDSCPPGAAPNSGDGDPDGSGMGDDMPGAPNAGDGIPDGSGW